MCIAFVISVLSFSDSCAISLGDICLALVRAVLGLSDTFAIDIVISVLKHL